MSYYGPRFDFDEHKIFEYDTNDCVFLEKLIYFVRSTMSLNI